MKFIIFLVCLTCTPAFAADVTSSIEQLTAQLVNQYGAAVRCSSNLDAEDCLKNLEQLSKARAVNLDGSGIEIVILNDHASELDMFGTVSVQASQNPNAFLVAELKKHAPLLAEARRLESLAQSIYGVEVVCVPTMSVFNCAEALVEAIEIGATFQNSNLRKIILVESEVENSKIDPQGTLLISTRNIRAILKMKQAAR